MTSDRRRFWTLQLAGWSAFYLAMSFSRIGSFPLSYMLVDKLALTLLGVVASMLLRSLLKPLIDNQAGLWRVVTVCVLASYALAAVWTAAFNVTGIQLRERMLGRTYAIDSIGELFSGTVYHAFTLVAWGFLYLGIRHHYALHAARERALRAEAMAERARLNALQYQLNPHFFFNALNAVSTLIVERRNDEATTMIARLGDFLRATLGQDSNANITLAEELGFVQRYLDIEQIRFGDRLAVQVDVDEEAYVATVPLLLLQPLIENAIRHGIARLAEGGVVDISAARINESRRAYLEIVILNSAPAETATPVVDAGIGLSNVRERLTMLYGADQRFSALRQSDGSFKVHLRLPFVAASHDLSEIATAAMARR